MQRREFLQTLGASAALALAGCGSSAKLPFGSSSGNNAGPTPPHLILVTVDQLRYPVHFPAGINTPDEFMARFIPNTDRHVWRDGVKFSNHQIAAAACTPSCRRS
jgi:hypothetical protein